MKDLKNEIRIKGRRIKELESLLEDKKCKELPCQTISTQVNIQEHKRIQYRLLARIKC